MPLNLSHGRRTLALAVRHGRTSHNEGRPRIRAWDDLPLSRDGELDADVAGNTLKAYSPKQIFSSDLIRDTQTAHRIAALNENVPVDSAFELRTADMGEWTGMYTDELAPQIRQWFERYVMKPPGGESYDQLVARLYPWIDNQLALVRQCGAICPTVFVSHGRPIAALDSRYRMVPPIQGKMPKPGGIAEINEMPDGRIELEFLGPTEDLIEDA